MKLVAALVLVFVLGLGACPERPSAALPAAELRPASSSIAPMAPLSWPPASSQRSPFARHRLAAAFLDRPLSPAASAVSFLEQRQASNGGFAEKGEQPDIALTEWATFALVAGGGSADARAAALGFLKAHEDASGSETDVALASMARTALGDRPDALLSRLRAYRSGNIVNATIWTVLALRQAGESVSSRLVRALGDAQGSSGGWSWTRHGVPDSNDTAVAIEALRAVGVTGRPIDRGLAYLARCRNRDGGYGLVAGRPSDSQSTAWAVQALLAARARSGAAPFRFLAKMRQADGSYRYSVRYSTTPVWVTAQVVPALAHKPFPLP